VSGSWAFLFIVVATGDLILIGSFFIVMFFEWYWLGFITFRVLA